VESFFIVFEVRTPLKPYFLRLIPKISLNNSEKARQGLPKCSHEVIFSGLSSKVCILFTQDQSKPDNPRSLRNFSAKSKEIGAN
jgi:hypothetical protein